MASAANKDNKNEKSGIILHQFPRTKSTPNPSPYAMKVETFLRMTKLPYTADFKKAQGPRGKTPWITDEDGQAVTDSQVIIDHLIKKHNIQMLKLTPEETAVARGLRALLEDNWSFVMSAENGIHSDAKLLLNYFPRVVPRAAPDCLQTLVVKKIRSNIGKQAKVQGMGLRDRDELHSIGLSDLEALSTWLGNKPYLMGSAPCPLDCTAFGFLAMLFLAFPEDYFFRKEAEKQFPNLKAYAERIKKTYWPDWDELLAKE
jgi:glutathione S-transferase